MFRKTTELNFYDAFFDQFERKYPLRIEIDIKFDFKLWYPRQFFIPLQLDCARTCTPCMYCDVSSLDAMLLLDKQGTSRSPDSYTSIPLERQSSSRSRLARRWRLVHLAHAALFPSAIVGESFRAARERRFVRLSGGRKRAASRKGRNTREKLLGEGWGGGGNNRLNCLGPNERAGNRRRIWCHVTFPYIPRRDGCIACLLDHSISREGKLVEGERFISVRFFRSSYRAW